MKLSDIVQGQNERVNALENADLDDNMLIPKISKLYEDIYIKSKIKVAKATYYKCNEVICSESQINTKSYIESYF